MTNLNSPFEAHHPGMQNEHFRIIGDNIIDKSIFNRIPNIISISKGEIKEISIIIQNYIFGIDNALPSIITNPELIEFLIGLRTIVEDEEIIDQSSLISYIQLKRQSFDPNIVCRIN